MSNPLNRASMRGQLTLRGVVIGVLGCVIITASSAYTALKMGALPWPIVFAAVISLFFLKLMGNASLNEANVTHTIMSAGAMVAGGLAFTIPGAWMLGYADQISWLEMFIVAPSWACWPPRSSTVTLSWTPRLSSPPATPQLRPCAQPRPAAKPASSSLAPWPSPASIACCATPWALCPVCYARSTSPA